MRQIVKRFSKVQKFDCYKEFKNQVDSEKSSLAVMYFKADWNPRCEQSDAYVEKLSQQPEYLGYKFYQINTDKNPIARQFYNIKAEPEVIVTCLGAEMSRLIGADEQRFQNKLDEVQNYHNTEDFLPGTGVYEKWETEFLYDYDNYYADQDGWFR